LTRAAVFEICQGRRLISRFVVRLALATLFLFAGDVHLVDLA
jgi:hypothetical protein